MLPLFSGNQTQRAVDPNKLYSHVYDSLASARLSSAFVAGAKVKVTEYICLDVKCYTIVNHAPQSHLDRC